MLRFPVKLNTSGNKAGAIKQAGLSMVKSTMSSSGNGNTQDEMKPQYAERANSQTPRWDPVEAVGYCYIWCGICYGVSSLFILSYTLSRNVNSWWIQVLALQINKTQKGTIISDQLCHLSPARSLAQKCSCELVPVDRWIGPRPEEVLWHPLNFLPPV